MFALVIFGILIAYFALAVFSVRAAVRGARESGLPQKQRWVRGSLVALVFYLIPFWDWIPTVVAHEYYCATEAKFEVFKTIEQWKAENAAILGTLKYDQWKPPRKVGDYTSYDLNQRIVEEGKNPYRVFLSVTRQEARILDRKTNEVLARYVDFRTGYASFAVGGEGAWKFWLKQHACVDAENGAHRMYARNATRWTDIGRMSK
jgi:hypothetical protein